MDEFVLFRKMTLNKTLKIEQSTKGKYDKTCITINLACNVIESHKLELWFIGKATKSQCFEQSFIHIKNFQMV